MNSEKMTTTSLEDVKVNVKLKLASLWLVLMLIYIYVDIFGFYKPGVIKDILAGKVWEFEITQEWAVGALILMLIPIFMIFLSLAFKATINRWLNIIVGILYIVVGIGTLAGENWIFYIVGHIIGIVILIFIIWTAWMWPKAES